jgi:hypothetical protein
MNNSTFSIQLRTHGGPLTVQVKFDERIASKILLTNEITTVTGSFNDDPGITHSIEIELLDKLQEHTKLDLNGNIAQDRTVQVLAVKLDDIHLGNKFNIESNYTHNFNGTGAQTVDTFYGIMGCNGTVKFEFTSPVYIWLLENM